MSDSIFRWHVKLMLFPPGSRLVGTSRAEDAGLAPKESATLCSLAITAAPAKGFVFSAYSFGEAPLWRPLDRETRRCRAAFARPPYCCDCLCDSSLDFSVLGFGLLSSIDQLLDNARPPYPYPALQGAKLPVRKVAVSARLQSLQHLLGFQIWLLL